MMTKPAHLLSAIEIPPTTPAKRTIIWLHGLGADGSDFVPIQNELQLPPTAAIRFIFPHAPIMPITINLGQEMRAWYDIRSFNIDGEIDKAGIKKSMAEVQQLIDHEISRGIASENILLAGFSQGAVIALSTGLEYKQKLGGLIALSGYLPFAQEVLQNTSPTNYDLPIFIAHGTEDAIVPYALGKAAYLALKQAGYPVTWRSYPIQHSVCHTEVKDISQWISSNQK